MIGKKYYCKIHGEYIQEGESKKCPECDYIEYIDFVEEFEYENDILWIDEEPH
jgi:hypothetical protein